MSLNKLKLLKSHFDLFFAEDEIAKNFIYTESLPSESVQCSLKIKDDLVLSGLPFFFEAFNYLSDVKIKYEKFLEYEGQAFKKEDASQIEFTMPFNVALSAERIALNLLQRASSISTHTNRIVQKTKHTDIKILDTRKTTPGLRFLEKYAVNMGGGYNHRFNQTDAWMIKDNHKSFFGGVEGAVNYFKKMNSFYTPLIMEIHDLNELQTAYNLGVKYFLLDNFSPIEIKKAVELKEKDMSFEVSGGITLDTIDNYLISGVDAISMGEITYNAPHVDLSLKFKRLNEL